MYSNRKRWAIGEIRKCLFLNPFTWIFCLSLKESLWFFFCLWLIGWFREQQSLSYTRANKTAFLSHDHDETSLWIEALKISKRDQVWNAARWAKIHGDIMACVVFTAGGTVVRSLEVQFPATLCVYFVYSACLHASFLFHSTWGGLNWPQVWMWA